MFWVEVTNDAKDNRITGIKSFVGGETLDKYSNVPKELWSKKLPNKWGVFELINIK